MFSLATFLAVNIGAGIALTGLQSLMKQKKTIIGALFVIAITIGVLAYNITGTITLINQGVSNTGWIVLGLFSLVTVAQLMGVYALVRHGISTAVYHVTTTPQKRAYDRSFAKANQSLNNFGRSLQNN